MSVINDAKAFQFELADELASIEFAGQLAEACEQGEAFADGLVVYLYGDLGAGKSFFSRAFIQHFMPGQKVKSPTYTLIESYNFSTNSIHHLDLYRLCDPEELEYLAVRDLFSENFIALVEWPQKGEPLLPAADLAIELIHQDQGRKVKMLAQSPKAEVLLESIKARLA
ncbi:tRNA (adenosine(37)-N6)-threonylcarbamoyltransferase complex ATPase subunit type 1 TsaE [Thiomicrorhabdus sediminis]|uniref:tRNA threonylcarbamoyladenosine biosynthesis protein TsaE n=1 Tax=Thiomicrorhabdus sediminis TaxID=2580412 RepID=A0A4P9K7J2_9GAMM|nr:tRNA (adenosine(37)-N6)-threonylcarbamoyltransferase complex ATPase subunit type 1 TsaE [Thiomicrorhabdus sediminis]QCU91104.1 tRNA (adenosine(37)-N6)-threonylcarbamoyltransferase complex ATPase subunit type 1 TsaE [Thiomicrorhabdus sediminis]